MFVKFKSFQPTSQGECFIRIIPEQVQAIADTYSTGPAGGKIAAVFLVDRDEPLLLVEEADDVVAKLDAATGPVNA